MKVREVIKKLQDLEKDLGNVIVLAQNQNGEFEELEEGFIDGDNQDNMIYIGVFSTQW